MSENSYSEILKNGIWKNNPGLVQLLGLCPLLAVTSTAVNGLALGTATLVVLILSNFFISLVRKIVLPEIRIMIYMLIITSLVTCAELIMRAWLPTLDKALGLYIALIATNCVIMARAESFAARNTPLKSAFDGLSNGIGVTLVLTTVGIIRELSGQGTIFSGIQELFGDGAAVLTTKVFASENGFLIAILPPGAFITLGLLVAGKNWLDNRYKSKRQNKRVVEITKI